MKSFGPIIAVTVLLAACGDSKAPGSGATQPSAVKGEGVIACATGDSRQWERACTIETMRGADGTTLVLRAPDGGFRRLVIARDGRGVVAADGAEQAVVTPAGEGLIEVAIGNDRYRLPATVKSASR
ncbi:MAG: hypothetical protein JWN69_94 [Alphaproteobacteria bacterium]|nr:hypothetical protein [Alphaproteobacteria bacterium]